MTLNSLLLINLYPESENGMTENLSLPLLGSDLNNTSNKDMIYSKTVSCLEISNKVN